MDYLYLNKLQFACLENAHRQGIPLCARILKL